MIGRRGLHDAVTRVAETPLRKRESIPGLSQDRGDSIVGGALGIETLVETVESAGILVSGQGVREGIAYSLLASTVPDAPAVRRESVAALTARFTTWNEEVALRRGAVIAQLAPELLPGAAEELLESLEHASCVLDTGRSMDFFDRHRHAAEIVLATELDGFSHREVALLSAILRAAREDDVDLRPLGPILKGDDRDPIQRAGLVLALADDIEERCPRGATIEVRCEVGRREIRLDVPALAGWRPRGLGRRFERTFDRRLLVRPGGA
jgi:exopolyphosphatase/guanosine-5'-triphosphate,3'-diphosphate pyrophosphatase